MRHLGEIRALAVSTMIFATAVAPAAFGWLLESGVRFGSILLACAAAASAAAAMALAALRGPVQPAVSDAQDST